MLISFSARNFRSLRDRTELSFVASSDSTLRDTHCIPTELRAAPWLTRSALVYGANASGKSNLIFAMVVMANLVKQSTSLKDTDFIKAYTPFRLDSVSEREPTEFEINLLIDGVRYEYGFVYDARRIRAEWLTVYRKAKGQRWFERRWDEQRDAETWAPFSANFTGPRETWRKATRPAALFLTTAVQLNSELLKPLFDWFTRGLIVLNIPGAPPIDYTLPKLEEPAFKTRALGLLRAADLHIADLRVERKPGHQWDFLLEPGKPSTAMPLEREVFEIHFGHRIEGGDIVWLEPQFESAGTQRLLAFTGPVLDAIDRGALLVIDELDGNLHPLITRFLLRLLHDPDVSRHGAQLWATTHDTTLLDTDLVRRDQVWFTEKDEQQVSRLVPLTDFSPRKNEALERGYLRGRYGGVPFVSSTRIQ
jgi:uncharacterized protein